jgi:hypothetical protein
MRPLYYVMLLALVVGCASVSDVPLPVATRYDDNPRARSAYLDGYRMGYRDFVGGQARVGPDVFSDDPVAKAGMVGWYDGRQAALEAAELQEDRDKATRQAQPK